MQETAVPIANRPGALGRQSAPAGRNVGDIERLASTLAGGALIAYGLRGAPATLPLSLVGGFLAYRGVTGHCAVYQNFGLNTASSPIVHVERSITVNKSPAEVYRFWRNFENLPRFMRHLESVTVLDERRSRWVATAPAGAKVAWDAEIFMEKEGELIAWRSLPEAQVSNAGTVRFLKAPGSRGCEVKVVMEYIPPAGQLGRFVARLFGEEPSQQVEDDMRHLKMILEAGELATNAMRPDGQKEA